MSIKLLQQAEEITKPEFPGWCEYPKAWTLISTIMALRPQVSVEIGVYAGKSFLPIALAHKETGVGFAIGIDPWNTAAATEGYEGEHFKWWSSQNLESIYNFFQTKIDEYGVRHCCQIIRKKSDDVTPQTDIDFLHIDGQHSDQAIRDVERFASKVRIGGLVCSDDVTGGFGPGVGRSVEKLKSMGFVQLYTLGEGAMFQRIK